MANEEYYTKILCLEMKIPPQANVLITQQYQLEFTIATTLLSLLFVYVGSIEEELTDNSHCMGGR